jgi:hypothetical protein
MKWRRRERKRGLSEDLLACELVFKLHHFYVDRLQYIHQV